MMYCCIIALWFTFYFLRMRRGYICYFYDVFKTGILQIISGLYYERFLFITV